jgi:hypothetical protein
MEVLKMKDLFNKMEALLMAATYAQAGAQTAAMECLETEYGQKNLKSKHLRQKKRKHRQLRL